MEKVFILFNKDAKIIGVYASAKLALEEKKTKSDKCFYMEFPVRDKVEDTEMKSIVEVEKRVYDPKHFNDIMPFGKYKGETIGNIIQKDPSYLKWCINNLSFEMDDDCVDLIEASINK